GYEKPGIALLQQGRELSHAASLPMCGDGFELADAVVRLVLACVASCSGQRSKPWGTRSELAFVS
ncbi:MAG: hypothetical protein ABTS22_05205, partial [Accumulibacter sp.]|uniref:hypothetical protein n=1 Tax=Accumulibacter sp. TaxID=2053492 RepID=UPI00331511EE